MERVNVRKRFAILIGVAAAGVMALGAQSAAAAPNICVAANDDVRVQKGAATCNAIGTGSVALANGYRSSATATGGDHNRARAIGDDSSAYAVGDNNTAT